MNLLSNDHSGWLQCNYNGEKSNGSIIQWEITGTDCRAVRMPQIQLCGDEGSDLRFYPMLGLDKGGDALF
jgi:hypothetical protein